MRKWFAALAALLMLLLTACGSTQAGTSKSMIESLSGTYVGKNGSALTLFPDGTSEYYYMLYSSTDVDKGAGAWSYKDGTLTWMYNDEPITAKINKQSAFSFTFEQTDGWNREQYIKASDIAEKRTASEYQQIMRDTLQQPEMDNFDESLNKSYGFGGLTVEIPFYWFVDSTEEGRITYKAESAEVNAAMLMIDYETDWSFSTETFEDISVNLWNAFADNTAYDNGYSIVKEPGMISVNQLAGIQGITYAEVGGYPLYSTNTLLFDENSETFLKIELITIGDTLFKYDSDYTKIINSVAVAENAKASTSGSGREETSSGDASEVTPELKAFLDSYEEFMNQYIAFLQKYEHSDDPYAMMSDYMKMLRQYKDFSEKIDKYDTDNMSKTDSAYYFKVMTRIAERLYAVSNQ